MEDLPAEMSSLSASLDDLCRRVTAIANRFAAAKRDDVATELYAVERAVAGAQRRLSHLARSLLGRAERPSPG